jgi:hypothetical protein
MTNPADFRTLLQKMNLGSNMAMNPLNIIFLPLLQCHYQENHKRQAHICRSSRAIQKAPLSKAGNSPANSV